MQKKLLAIAVAAIGAVGSAHAGVMGQSVLEITNFQFLNAAGTTQLSAIPGVDFDVLKFTDSTNATANLNGTIASHAKNQSTFGTLDDAQQCVGIGGVNAAPCAAFGQNNFSHRSAPGTVDVARADTLLAGSPLSGTPFGTAADAHVVNEGQLTAAFGSGNIQSNLGLTATISFSLANSQAVTINLDSLSHLIANVDLGDSGSARASEQWTIEIRDAAGGVVFSWSPNGHLDTITGGVETADTCDLQRAVNASLPGQTSTYDCAGHHVARTGVLDAAQTYSLGLRHAGDVDITRDLPEPSSVMLAGLALAGLGFGARRKQIKHG